jgi:hypothetical protein
MSNEIERMNEPSEQAIALFLHENDSDKLTDALVEALYEAFRILNDDTGADTVH